MSMILRSRKALHLLQADEMEPGTPVERRVSARPHATFTYEVGIFTTQLFFLLFLPPQRKTSQPAT